MKLRYIICCLCLWFSVNDLIGQVIAIRIGIPLVSMELGGSLHRSATMSSWGTLSGEAKNSMVFVVNSPTHCSPKWTNIISNTNLFSRTEQQLLMRIPAKYRNVTTNSGLSGTVFTGLSKLKSPILFHDAGPIWVSHFRNTNSDAQIEVWFCAAPHDQKGTVVTYRTKSGDGYNAAFTSTEISRFRQFKSGQLNGLWADFEGGHCVAWLHFVKGKAVGKWLVWNEAGTLYMEAKFKKPYDLVGPISFH